MNARGIVAAIAVCAACMPAGVARAQTLTIVDSEQHGEFWAVAEENYADPYGHSETDDEAISFLGVMYYEQPDAGYVQFHPTTVSAEILSESATEVILLATSSMSAILSGPLYDVFIEHYIASRAMAVVQVDSANGIDDVEATITFNNRTHTSGTLVYECGPSHRAGDEYWWGSATDNSNWILGPEWSENVPYELLQPNEPMHVVFNLIVESGSQIMIRAGAGHGYSPSTFNVGIGFGYDGGYEVVAETRIDVDP